MFDAKSWQLGKDGSPHGERRMKMISADWLEALDTATVDEINQAMARIFGW
jgi:hypothetical protein